MMFYSNYGSNLVSFLRDLMLKNIATLKSQSMVNQGHWKWYRGHWKCHHSIERIWLPINVPYQPWAYLVPFPK